MKDFEMKLCKLLAIPQDSSESAILDEVERVLNVKYVNSRSRLSKEQKEVNTMLGISDLTYHRFAPKALM